MASGYGLNGGPSRCFPFWQEVMACYVINTNADDISGKSKCIRPLEDYYECLHHRKEVRRIISLENAYRNAEATSTQEKKFTPGQVRKLGIVEGSLQEKNLRYPKWLPIPKNPT